MTSSPHPPSSEDDAILSPCGGSADSFGMLLHFLRQGMVHHLDRLLAEQDLGINFTQFRMLKQLSGVPWLSASELARRLEHDAGALTRLLDKMQERGFIKRLSCAEDRRSVQISLTDAGRALTRPLRHISDELTELALSDLSPDEQQSLISMLNRVRATLER